MTRKVNEGNKERKKSKIEREGEWELRKVGVDVNTKFKCYIAML